MAEVAFLDPKTVSLTAFPWGHGVYDLRYFHAQVLFPEDVAKFKAAPGTGPFKGLTLDGATEVVERTMKEAAPGIYWVGNPLLSTYGKWSIACMKAGFIPVDGCAINRVYRTDWKWKGSMWDGCGIYDWPSGVKVPTPQTWESQDGFGHWTHAFYYIKPGLVGKMKFDWSKRDLTAHTGDNHNSLWQHAYGGRNKPPLDSEYGDRSRKLFLPRYARMSKNCGIAMGEGLPESGKWLDEEFFTVATLPVGEEFPVGYTPIVEFAGTQFAHNLAKLDTSQAPCPHLKGMRSSF